MIRPNLYNYGQVSRFIFIWNFRGAHYDGRLLQSQVLLFKAYFLAALSVKSLDPTLPYTDMSTLANAQLTGVGGAGTEGGDLISCLTSGVLGMGLG